MSGRSALIERLCANARISGAWSAAFAAVDRAAFVPSEIWFDDDQGRPRPISRATDPDRWTAAVYADEPVVTQFDDGRTEWPAVGAVASSSSSQPAIVLAMLDALDVADGHRVLEIGTGTGWHTALLCARLGADYVISVEIDRTLADRARELLARAGYRPTVRHGDGAAGWAALAPYDRVIATCSVGVVPPAWIAQARPGGRVLVPWGPPMANEHLVRFDVRNDGSAVGSIVGPSAFMRLRAQRWHVVDEPDEFDDIADRAPVELPPRVVLGDDARLAVALRMGECRAIYETGADGEVLWLLAADSWARVTDATAAQAGARRLWDEAVAGYRWWRDAGAPDRARFRVTVDPARQWVWLDRPADVVREYSAESGLYSPARW